MNFAILYERHCCEAQAQTIVVCRLAWQRTPPAWSVCVCVWLCSLRGTLFTEVGHETLPLFPIYSSLNTYAYESMCVCAMLYRWCVSANQIHGRCILKRAIYLLIFQSRVLFSQFYVSSQTRLVMIVMLGF